MTNSVLPPDTKDSALADIPPAVGESFIAKQLTVVVDKDECADGPISKLPHFQLRSTSDLGLSPVGQNPARRRNPPRAAKGSPKETVLPSPLSSRRPSAPSQPAATPPPPSTPTLISVPFLALLLEEPEDLVSDEDFAVASADFSRWIPDEFLLRDDEMNGMISMLNVSSHRLDRGVAFLRSPCASWMPLSKLDWSALPSSADEKARLVRCLETLHISTHSSAIC